MNIHLGENLVKIYNNDCDFRGLVSAEWHLPESLKQYADEVEDCCHPLGGVISSRQVAALIYVNWKRFIKDK